MYKLVQISKTYKTKTGYLKALDSIDLEFKSNGFYLIYGQSGSGKTTLLHLLAQFEKPSEGKIDGFCNASEIGVVFQNSNLIEGLTVKENLAIFGFKEDEITSALTQVNLLDKMNEKAKVLSGGEKQRLSIARALLKKIHILLLDEPTGNLDESNSASIFTLLKALSQEILVIVVSHNYNLAKAYADVEIQLDHGKIISLKENNTLKDKALLPIQQTNKPLSFFWQIQYGLKMVKSKIAMNILSFVLISLTLYLFISIMSLNTFNLKHNLYIENKDVSALPVSKNEYNPFLQESRSICKGTALKKELEEISTYVFPYINSNSISMKGAYIQKPSIIVLPDDYALEHLDGEAGVVITDLLNQYYFPNQNAIGEEMDITINTGICSFDLKHKITGVYSTGFTEDLYYKYKKDIDSEYEYKYGCIYIKESIIKKAFKAKSVRLVGFSFLDSVFMKYYVENKYTYKVFEGENLILGRPIQNKYEIILDKTTYNSLFPNEIDFKEKEVYFRDIHSSPNAAFYAETFNLYDLTKSLKVVGVTEEINLTYLISEEFLNEILENCYDYQFTGFLIIPAKENMKSWIDKSLDHNLIIQTSTIYRFNQQREVLAEQVFYAFLIIIFLTILFIVYSSYNQIQYKEKEIIIFKALHVSKRKIFMPFFLVEAFKVFIGVLFVCPFVGYGVKWIYNLFFSNSMEIGFILVSPITYIYTILFCIFLVGLALFIPFLKINYKEIGIAFKDCE